MKWEYLIGMPSMSCCLLFAFMGIYRPVTNADYPSLEKLAEGAVKEKQKFERLVVSKEKLLEMFHVGLLTSFQTL
jgi:threonyl-tRNA synthetase